MARVKEVAGDAVASQRVIDRHLHSMGVAWAEFVRQCERLTISDLEVYRVTIKGDFVAGTDILVVLCAVGGDGYKVAFHHCDDMTTLWTGLAARLANGSLQWKEDQYADK